MTLSDDKRPVIVKFCRTAFTRARDPREAINERVDPKNIDRGSSLTARPKYKSDIYTFQSLSPPFALNRLFHALLRDNHGSLMLDPKDIKRVLTGTSYSEYTQGCNVARQATLFPALQSFPGLTGSLNIPGTTVSEFCTSGFRTIAMASDMVKAGSAQAVICSAIEMMSQIPPGGWHVILDPDICDAYGEEWLHMGRTAENLAREYNISQAEQHEFSFQSHYRAAMNRKRSQRDIVSIPIEKDPRKFPGIITHVDQDECIRVKIRDVDPAGKTEEQVREARAKAEDINIRRKYYMGGLKKLKPAFDDEGTVTAADSSPVTDGAAAMLITSLAFARANNLPVKAEILAYDDAAVEPERMGISPVHAARNVLAATGRTLQDMGPIEINEAFASVALACARELGIVPQYINRRGGALALGHPLPVSGGRVISYAADQLLEDPSFANKDHALIGQCAGAGQGMAMILRRV